MTEDKPKKNKGGRPKLKDGEKGNYHLSHVERKKRVTRKRIKVLKNAEAQAKKKLDALNDKSSNIKHAEKLIRSGGLAVEENVKKLPKSVRAKLDDNTQI